MIQALSRCMDILNRVGNRTGGMTSAELSRELGLKYTTVYNLVQSLEEEGLLEYGDGNRLLLGGGIGRLQEMRLQNVFRATMARRMAELAGKYDCSMTLSKYNRGQLLGRLWENGKLRESSYVLNVYNTVSGVAHAAFLPEKEAELLLEKNCFTEVAAQQWRSEKKFQKTVEECRHQGYALLPFELHGRVGIPLFCRERLMGVLTFQIRNANAGVVDEFLKGVNELSRIEVNDNQIESDEFKEI